MKTYGTHSPSGFFPRWRWSGLGPAAARAATLWPGLLVCAVIALAATFIAEHQGGPQLLYALLIGLACNFLAGVPRVAAGVAVCARTGLRCGVALLGARITVDQVASLGAATGIGIACSVVATILLGVFLAAVMQRPREEGVISGCSVGICGASAALAVAAALPPTKENERFTLLAVVGVTLLSTIAMVVYPPLLNAMHASPRVAGIFLGGTIHDIAQVVAAGLILGPQAGETATIVKLFRIAMLVPIVAVIALLYRGRSGAPVGSRIPAVPPFLLWFLFFVALTSLGVVGSRTAAAANDASRWLLVAAIGASGIKTHFADLMKLGWRPVAMLLGETVFIALLVFAWSA
ncbi:putative sulfate exporter family transporter [Paracidovorax avenae]|uniref:YeiH family protein n=1 Tax=Paracidovorax avenae TaxID=80867 RepID=UPI000D17A36E|nr:putative sulfate exporter family transporter [Paracidovorax avenae]AVS71799.1 putative sulfate exporter family transporter [Paracidovorax avenae]